MKLYRELGYKRPEVWVVGGSLVYVDGYTCGIGKMHYARSCPGVCSGGSSYKVGKCVQTYGSGRYYFKC